MIKSESESLSDRSYTVTPSFALINFIIRHHLDVSGDPSRGSDRWPASLLLADSRFSSRMSASAIGLHTTKVELEALACCKEA